MQKRYGNISFLSVANRVLLEGDERLVNLVDKERKGAARRWPMG